MLKNSRAARFGSVFFGCAAGCVAGARGACGVREEMTRIASRSHRNDRRDRRDRTTCGAEDVMDVTYVADVGHGCS